MQEKKEFEIAIIGTGFAGIGMGIKLLQAGITDFVILEKANDIGGTWRDNTYPGAACDVSSHLYSFSFEPNPNWSRMFSGQKEIYTYLKHCANKYNLQSHIRYEHEVTGGSFNEQTGKWSINITDKEPIKAHYWINGMGPLNRPSFPTIAGMETFKGDAFHSSNWDHSVDIKDKKVAVIGTGASSIQITPSIAPNVEQLYVYQRTPAWIMPKPDRDMSGFEKKLFKVLPFMQNLYRWRIYWVNELTAYILAYKPKYTSIIKSLALRHMKKRVKDEQLREKLTPNYMVGCKRILLSNDYYPAFTRPNVKLITEGIEQITENSIITKDGTETQVDAIIYCTGFMAAEFPAYFKVKGLNGQTLDQEWKEAPEAYLGTTVSGFPNMYFIIGPNTGLGHTSMIFMIESQIAYIMDALKKARQSNYKYMNVKKDLQDEYNKTLQSRLVGTAWDSGCVSWYKTKAGKNTSIWPGFTFEFRKKTKKVNDADYEWVK